MFWSGRGRQPTPGRELPGARHAIATAGLLTRPDGEAVVLPDVTGVRDEDCQLRADRQTASGEVLGQEEVVGRAAERRAAGRADLGPQHREVLVAERASPPPTPQDDVAALIQSGDGQAEDAGVGGREAEGPARPRGDVPRDGDRRHGEGRRGGGGHRVGGVPAVLRGDGVPARVPERRRAGGGELGEPEGAATADRLAPIREGHRPGGRGCGRRARSRRRRGHGGRHHGGPAGADLLGHAQRHRGAGDPRGRCPVRACGERDGDADDGCEPRCNEKADCAAARRSSGAWPASATQKSRKTEGSRILSPFHVSAHDVRL